MSRADASLGVGGALVRPKAGFCVFRESRPAVDTTRGFGFVGSLDCQSAIHASRGRRHGAAVPSKAQCECVYIPGVVATVALAAVLGERRVTSRQWRARSTVRSARSPRARPTAASNASCRRADDVAGGVRARSCRIRAGLRRGVRRAGVAVLR